MTQDVHKSIDGDQNITYTEIGDRRIFYVDVDMSAEKVKEFVERFAITGAKEQRNKNDR